MTSKPVTAFGRAWRYVWIEDECLLDDPDAERVATAWARLFSEPYPNLQSAMGVEDAGDACAYLFGEHMMISSYAGHSIWVPEIIAGQVPTHQRAADTQGANGERP